MNGNKLFAVSIAVLALALGFFLGTLKGGCCCGGMDMSCCKKGAPCEHSAMNAPCEHGNHHMGKHKGPHGDFKGPGPRFKGKMDFAEMDSLLQVTPEQKAAIEASRTKGDSLFKDLRKNKHEAEKALGEALESGDKNAIETAKAKVLDADRALLEHRINGVQTLAGILSKEQFDKFNQFHKEQMKKFREFRKGPKGPHEEHGPHGNPPPMPPQQ
ncbi:Spy/CpxP family protein refolding chaperone [Fibrobacter sp.]|uniref:Spy/CpxP family protein refolding chaperone n=1 Tax=Fibrobacter sp. TaxID=35828 RepID=UPI00388FFCE6